MGLVSRLLLGAPLEARDIPDLEVDLERLLVAGLGARAPRDEVERRLGPPEDWFARRRGLLVYPALGLRLHLGPAGLTTFEVLASQEDEGHTDVTSFAGGWRPWRSRSAPDEAALTALLGPPTLREVDEQDGEVDEVCLEWARERTFVGADLTPEGRLHILYVDLDAAG